MTLPHWKTIWTALTRSAAALPAAGAVLGALLGAASGSTLKTTLEQRMIEPLAALSACDPLGRVLPPLKCLKVGTAL